MTRLLASVALALVAGCGTGEPGARRTPTGSPSSATPSPTPASSPSEPGDRCAEVDGSTLDIVDCYLEERAPIERQLQAQLAKARRMRSPDARRRLDESQRDWLRYRDSACLSAGDRWEGGTLAQVEIAGCQVRLTVERLELVTYLATSPEEG